MWRFAQARSIGRSHSKLLMPCQDQVRCSVSAGGRLIAALADGAGSAAKAESGAQIAVDSVAEFLGSVPEEQKPTTELLVEAAKFARQQLLDEATSSGAELREYASTLLIAMLGPNGGAALQIGDGVMVLSDGEESYSWVFWPQRGEYANTTRFLTDVDAERVLEVGILPAIVCDIALMSDGMEILAVDYSMKAAHDPFFKGMFSPLIRAVGNGEIHEISQSLKVFMGSDRVASRTDDDVSMILATRRGR